MIVEFIGCTGAGKTTLIAQIRKHLQPHATVASSFERMASPVGLRPITHPTLQNLIQEFMGLPFFLALVFNYHAFLRFTVRMLARQGRFTFFTFNYLRSLERTLGVYGYLRQAEKSLHGKQQFVFVDEGTIVPAHNIFVYNDVAYSVEEIARYASLVPLADVIVYVRAPVDSLVQRTVQRNDPPRELRGQSAAQIDHFVRRADQMFEELVRAKRIQKRMILVDNPPTGRDEYDALAQRIAETLFHWSTRENQDDPVSLCSIIRT